MARMTRKISRNIARANMKRHGILHPNKHHVYRNIYGLLVHEPSFFCGTLAPIPYRQHQSRKVKEEKSIKQYGRLRPCKSRPAIPILSFGVGQSFQKSQ